jgi:hypothetical protein
VDGLDLFYRADRPGSKAWAGRLTAARRGWGR